MTYRTIDGLEYVPLSAVIEFVNDEYARREKEIQSKKNPYREYYYNKELLFNRIKRTRIRK